MREYLSMPTEQRRRFAVARTKLVAALRQSPGGLPPGLRVKRVQGHAGVYELTFAPDGRATFHYGDEVIPGQPHIVWRRIGDHSILERP